MSEHNPNIVDDLGQGEPILHLKASSYGALEAAIAFHDTLAQNGADREGVALAYDAVLKIRGWRLDHPTACTENAQELGICKER